MRLSVMRYVLIVFAALALVATVRAKTHKDTWNLDKTVMIGSTLSETRKLHLSERTERVIERQQWAPLLRSHDQLFIQGQLFHPPPRWHSGDMVTDLPCSVGKVSAVDIWALPLYTLRRPPSRVFRTPEQDFYPPFWRSE